MCLYDFCPDGSQFPSEANILIAGMNNQPYEAYRELSSVNSDHEIFAEYSMLGWNAKNSARQLDKIHFAPTTRVIVYTISIGDKIARYMNRCNYIYSINPCPNPCVLKTSLQKKLPPVAIILRMITFLFGWIAVIPLPIGDTLISLALFSDQLWEASVNRDTPPMNKGITSIIFSAQDEFIDQSNVKNFYKRAPMPEVIINTKHGRTTDLAWSVEYNNALEKLKGR